MFFAKLFYAASDGAAVFLFPYITLYLVNVGASPTLVGVLCGFRPWLAMSSAIIIPALADHWRCHRSTVMVCYALSVTLRLAMSMPVGIVQVAALMLAGDFFGGPVWPMVDALIMSQCKEESDWGRQRVWASISWGGLAPLAGWMVERHGLPAGFTGFALLALPAMAATCVLEYRPNRLPGPSSPCPSSPSSPCPSPGPYAMPTNRGYQAVAVVDPDSGPGSKQRGSGGLGCGRGGDGAGAVKQPGAWAGVPGGAVRQRGRQGLLLASQWGQGLSESLLGQQVGAEEELEGICPAAAWRAAPESQQCCPADPQGCKPHTATHLALLTGSLPSSPSSSLSTSQEGEAASGWVPGQAGLTHAKAADCPWQIQPLLHMPVICTAHPVGLTPSHPVSITPGSHLSHPILTTTMSGEDLALKTACSSTTLTGCGAGGEAAGAGGVRPASLAANLGLLLSRATVWRQLLQCMAVGLGTGLISAYLLLYVRHLQATALLMGVLLFVDCAAETPIFYYQDKVMLLLSPYATMNLAVGAMVVRLLLYGLVPHIPGASAWALLPIELLQGLTVAGTWSAITVLSSRLAPPGLVATMQGLSFAVLAGLGAGLGGLTGGLLLSTQMGWTVMWCTCCGLVALVWAASLLLPWLACWLYDRCARRQKAEDAALSV
ncbi:major facilitator superfamily domain-containing protein [Haematococcus lacustris]